MIDAIFVELKQAIMAIREHRHEFLEVLFLPKEFVWQEKVELKLELDKDVLQRTSFAESKQRLNIAKTKSLKGNRKTVAKECVHSLRYLLFAEQILKKGEIEDYSAANEYFSKIVLDKSFLQKKENWKWLEEEQLRIIERVKQLANRTRDFTTKKSVELHLLRSSLPSHLQQRKQLLSTLPETSIPSLMSGEDHPLEIVNFLRKFGVGKLLQETQMFSVFHPKHQNLVLFTSSVTLLSFLFDFKINSSKKNCLL